MSVSAATTELGLNNKRTTVRLTGLPLLALSFQTLGIIYSDIGTLPLYVLNGIWPPGGNIPSQEDIIGGISAIIWALTLLPLLKYVLISLYFGTNEAHIPPVAQCLFGTSLTMADGILTPAVSVTSAVAGIEVAKASIIKDIVPISVAFLVALFFVQQFGTARLAFAFAPVSFLWFLLLMGTGIYNITGTFFPGIPRAFDPSRAVLLFVRTKNFSLLTGVLLAVTGCEAMFANLGQFNAASIRLSFCTFVYPGLILAYFGQGARLIENGVAILPQVFYNSIPGPANGPLFWIMFTFALLATLIASQAMITATFSLVQQVINSKAFPPVRMLYTSETIQGQVYIPAVNWALMIATIIFVVAFTDLTKLTNAYGFAVATVMFTTSFLIAIQIRYIKKLPVFISFGYFIIWGFFDGVFWVASLKKVPEGAWAPLMVSLILVQVMILWVWAKNLEDKFDGKNRMNLKHFIHQSLKGSSNDADDQSIDNHNEISYYFLQNGSSNNKSVDEKSTDKTDLQRIPSCAVFHKVTSGRGVPHTFIGFVRQWPALPRVVVFLSVCITSMARVPVEERYVVTKVRTIEGFYGVTYYIGFRDKFEVETGDLIEKICDLERLLNPAVSESLIQEIRDVSRTATHVAPHYHVVSKKVDVGLISPVVNYVRSMLIETIYRRLATIFPETENWLTSADEIIHVGINAVI